MRLLFLPLVLLALAASSSKPIPALAAVPVQTDTVVTVVSTWFASRADSVRVSYSTGVTRTHPAARGVDTLRVVRTTAAQTITATFTPLRGGTAFTPRTASLTIAARPLAPATIDSVRVDTVRSGTGGTPVVTPPPIDGPSAVPTAFTPNLPSGMRLVGDSDFDSPAVPGIDIINWDRNTVQSPTTHGVALITVDGRSVLRAWFPELNAGNGVGPLTIMTPELNSRSHYMAVRLRYSDNYEFHTNGEKLIYPVAQNPGGGSPLLNVGRNGELVGFDGPMNNPLRAPLAIAQTGAGVINRGRWITVEYHGRMNSPGQSDGMQRVWVDGRLVLDRQNLNLVEHTSQVLFRWGRLDFTRGGGPSSVLTPLGGQWVDVDRLAFYAGN